MTPFCMMHFRCMFQGRSWSLLSTQLFRSVVANRSDPSSSEPCFENSYSWRADRLRRYACRAPFSALPTIDSRRILRTDPSDRPDAIVDGRIED